ncbi:enoyl-CoA hydratase/isomerase family protein [Asticcacaulis sp. EMRT-3]|uniref:enoyl-CoA hydratase/isomerase family protein n=1 Tax=Asticcacaulis sp. EMRT-3 TaxID=3040349 RepID=UPI0024AF5057|nr:enoyl-CoA hydratase/isomerase family protein [Asticcacaulis sp. EMRT-3]MDI7775002.1 enoyl-CoA hydratase/isomerase family protein [Asticcacaulis sp. EMRT-3]
MTELVTRIDNGIGRITLNRPQALHALTTGMCARMSEALTNWADDPAVRLVMVDHAEGTRGFCAGGDIRLAAQSGRGDGKAGEDFFAVEYRLNVLIKRFSKPYLAIMDGVTMGGGVGVSIHGSHRIATDNTLFAMPETGIGLFPDVGGSWFLPRLAGKPERFPKKWPHFLDQEERPKKDRERRSDSIRSNSALGLWLALTGARLKGMDVAAAGIATHFVAAADLAALKNRLLAGAAPDDALMPYAQTVSEPSYAPHMAIINHCFSEASVSAILHALETSGDAWGRAQAEILKTRSPMSLCVAYAQLRRGANLTRFEDAMRMEYRLACHILRSHDFSEGVRAVLEDKDNAPVWLPATVTDVTGDMVEAMFAPVTPELQL